MVTRGLQWGQEGAGGGSIGTPLCREVFASRTAKDKNPTLAESAEFLSRAATRKIHSEKKNPTKKMSNLNQRRIIVIAIRVILRISEGFLFRIVVAILLKIHRKSYLFFSKFLGKATYSSQNS